MLRPLILYSALAAVAVAVAVWFLVDSDDGQQTQVDAAAQPPDNPGDTAPGRPTTTTTTEPEPEPEPEPKAQQVEIKGRFGKACGDNGLCLEIEPPESESLEMPAGAPRPVNGQEIGVYRITYNGEGWGGRGLMSCDINSSVERYWPQVGGDTTEDGLRRFRGTLPANFTGELAIPGMFNIEQLIVDVSSLGVRHIFYGESWTITPEQALELFDELKPTVAEIEDHSRRPFNDSSCDWDTGDVPQ